MPPEVRRELLRAGVPLRGLLLERFQANRLEVRVDPDVPPAGRNGVLEEHLLEDGEGVPRMFEEMEASFLHLPSLAIDAGQFSVTLRNTPAFEGPSVAWQHTIQSLPLGVGQKRVLLAHPNGFTNEDYRKLSGVDRDQAYREIQEMVTLGVVKPAEAPGRGAVYWVAPDLHEARAFLEARIPALRAHFARKAELKNADYREIFSVTRYAASRELRRLVEEGILRLEGERRGAKYLPGPVLGPARAE